MANMRVVVIRVCRVKWRGLIRIRRATAAPLCARTGARACACAFNDGYARIQVSVLFLVISNTQRKCLVLLNLDASGHIHTRLEYIADKVFIVLTLLGGNKEINRIHMRGFPFKGIVPRRLV